MDTTTIQNIRNYYADEKITLFVGSGVSAGLGLPTWQKLIDKISEDLGYDSSIMSTYGDYLSIAEFYRLKHGTIGPLRSWMDREWHHSDIKIEDSEVHEIIAKSNIRRIYTTNYDRWLESAHIKHNIEYQKISSVSDLATSNYSKKQIIKLHGDFDDDDSIVLTETSYFERMSFENPLDIKLRSDLLENSFLFIGYSLSDINIRMLFYKLSKIWSGNALQSTRPSSYIFTHRPNPVASAVLQQWGIEVISSDEDDPGEALRLFMKDIFE